MLDLFHRVHRRPLCKGIASSLLAALVLHSLYGCSPPTPVDRIVDGRLVSGRYISSDAYAHYVRGRWLELQGYFAEARDYYQAALDEDPASVEIRTRLAFTLCVVGGPDVASAFEHARNIDPNYAPLFTSWSACQLRQGDLSQALESARRAVGLDPTGEEANQQLLEVTRRLGDQARVGSLARGFFAYGNNEARGSPARHGEHEPPREAAISATCRAVLLGDEQEVLSAARSLGVRDVEVAALAFHFGRWNLAEQVARRAFRAEPDEPSSWALLLLLASVQGQDEAYTELLTHPPKAQRVPSPLGRALLLRVLDFRVSGAVSEQSEGPASLRTVLDPKLEACLP